jgi:hypothetical protein
MARTRVKLGDFIPPLQRISDKEDAQHRDQRDEQKTDNNQKFQITVPQQPPSRGCRVMALGHYVSKI